MLLRELTEAQGVSGREDEVRQIIRKHLQGRVDELYTDPLGNLIAVKKGRDSQGVRVMVAAHMDEVGLMITKVQKDGTLRFDQVGGVDPRVLVSKVVEVGSERIPGVIGAKPIHLQEPGERQNALGYKQLFIDIGARDDKEAESKVKIGDLVSFKTQYEEWGDVVKAKALDDRVGCSLLLEILENQYSFDLYAAFTVQEEVGLRGAGPAAYGIEPTLALILEGTTCSDVPTSEPHQYTTSLGKGPVLTVMDRSVIVDKRLLRRLMEVAEREEIPFQFKQGITGGTDAGKIHLVHEGVPSAIIALPCRYIHSPASVMSRSDYNQSLRLAQGFLASLEKEGVPVL